MPSWAASVAVGGRAVPDHRPQLAGRDPGPDGVGRRTVRLPRHLGRRLGGRGDGGQDGAGAGQRAVGRRVGGVLVRPDEAGAVPHGGRGPGHRGQR